MYEKVSIIQFHNKVNLFNCKASTTVYHVFNPKTYIHVYFHLLLKKNQQIRVGVFNNILVISWRSVLLVEETGVHRENQWPAAGHWQTWSHNVVSSTPHLSGFKLTTLVAIGTDCIGRCKSNYHTIRTTMAPNNKLIHAYKTFYFIGPV